MAHTIWYIKGMATTTNKATGEGEKMTKGDLRLAICEENQRQGGAYVSAWRETEGMTYAALRNVLRILKKGG